MKSAGSRFFGAKPCSSHQSKKSLHHHHQHDHHHHPCSEAHDTVTNNALDKIRKVEAPTSFQLGRCDNCPRHIFGDSPLQLPDATCRKPQWKSHASYCTWVIHKVVRVTRICHVVLGPQRQRLPESTTCLQTFARNNNGTRTFACSLECAQPLATKLK